MSGQRATYYLDKTAVYREMAKKELKTLADLTRSAGVGNGTLYNALGHSTPVQKNILQAVAYALGCSKEDIIRKEPEPAPAPEKNPEDEISIQRQLTCVLAELRKINKNLESMVKVWEE